MYTDDTARFDQLVDLPALGLLMYRNDEFHDLLIYSRLKKGGYSHRLYHALNRGLS